MNPPYEIKSSFDNEMLGEDTVIDFNSAVRLSRSGSTCDAYVTRHHRRRVFVKRLKPEFRFNSVYRAAMEKEFELGVDLSHTSLPQYREFHGDYIIMDYVDGFTLSEILNSGHTSGNPGLSIAGKWLRRPENLRRFLTALIDVVSYLHEHNIVHSDIKPDNIMLTRSTHNLMLLDLDKAFTAWLDDTPGSFENFGLKKENSYTTDIDFKGIALIIDRLMSAGFRMDGLNEIRNCCYRQGVDAATINLLLKLDTKPKSGLNVKTIVGSVILLQFLVPIILLAISVSLLFALDKYLADRKIAGHDMNETTIIADTDNVNGDILSIRELYRTQDSINQELIKESNKRVERIQEMFKLD